MLNMDLDTVQSEDEIGGYTPLERPSCSTITVMDQQPAPEKIVDSDTDDDTQNLSTSDDSDDEYLIVKNKGSLGKRKRPAEPKKCSVNRPENPAKKTKYSVWSDIMQEDEIENQFVSSDFFGGGRGNESYNYKMKYYSNVNDNPYSKDFNKNCDNEPRKKAKVWTKQRVSRKPLVLPELQATVEDTAEAIALEIAKHLSEPKTELIERVVLALGKEKAMQLYNQTKEVEANGGILILNGARRRTSGGVFLKFVKDQKLSRREFEAIFNYAEDFDKNASTVKIKSKKRKAKPKSDHNSDLSELPLRYELEVPTHSEESDTNVLKNPPPSPVCQYPSASTSPFSFSGRFSPDFTSLSREPFDSSVLYPRSPDEVLNN